MAATDACYLQWSFFWLWLGSNFTRGFPLGDAISYTILRRVIFSHDSGGMDDTDGQPACQSNTLIRGEVSQQLLDTLA